MGAMQYRKHTLIEYFEKVASDHAVPGGGSAAAVCASLGVSLSLMVARIILPKKDLRTQKKLRASITRLRGLSKKIQGIIDEDPRIYKTVSEAYAVPKTNMRRPQIIERSLTAAYQVMYCLAEYCVRVCRENALIQACSVGAVANDIVVSNAMIEAAYTAASKTAEINVQYMKDATRKKQCARALKQLYKRMSIV